MSAGDESVEEHGNLERPWQGLAATLGPVLAERATGDAGR